MSIKINTAVLMLLMLFISISSSAQSPVYAQVSSKKVQVGVPFEYAIVITVQANNYQPPNFGDFSIVSGPGQSSSTQWINGVVSQQMTLSWGLVAKKEGKFTIGPAIVNGANQKYETNAIAIEAVKGAVAQNSGQTSDDPKYSSKVAGGDLYIKTGVSKNKCYLGEQITITQKVYSRHQLVGFQKFSQPTYDGFYAMAQESSSKGQQAMEIIEGVNYYTYELFRSVCIANKAGKINLNAIEGDVVIRKQSQSKPRNIFEQFFGGGGYEDVPVNVKSRSMTVEVLDLPQNGKPESFHGAVGNFSYKVEASKKELKANDAFNLKMTVSGKGNIKLLDAPELNLPEGFETYDPKVIENGNSKTFDYLIIPRNEGEFVLNNLDFSYFNLESKKYVTIPADNITIKVLAPDPNNSEARVYTPQNTIKESENDIRYIKKGKFDLIQTETEFFHSGTHIMLLLLPILLLATALLIRKNYLHKNSNIVLVKQRKAVRIAKKQLSIAEKLMKENKKDEFYNEILNAINHFLSNKLNIPISDISRDLIKQHLAKKQVTPDSIMKTMNTIETSEFARYAPGSVSGDLNLVYKNTIELITDLEEQLSKKSA
ncbi:MAG: protein BatD [Sphingobacteriaceae bacterium]|nr:protein BatD [Sphingobacteriaceae bacterium]